MKQAVSALVLLGLFAAVSLIAQSPAGWRIRADRSTSASDPDAPGPIKFVTKGAGFHATNPQAAVYWNPAHTSTGSYTVKGTFTLVEPSNHTNYYGLVFGGRNLEGASQTYVYFLVAQDGTWLVKRRDGDAVTQNVLPKTANAAIKTPDASGRSINALEVRVTPASIAFVVNGTEVNTWFGAARAVETAGVYGIRVNHFLEVHVDGFEAAATGIGAARFEASRSGTVAMTASVGRMLSPTLFFVKDDGAPGTAQDVLVLAPMLQRPLDANTPVTVFGEVVPCDADIADRCRGGSAVRASAVLTAKMVDLTKPLPPPMTADEETLSTLMKRIAPAFAALQQSIGGAQADTAGQHAAVLERSFSELEAFWKAKAKGDATGWAQNARLQAQSIERSAAAGQWDTAKVSAGTLGQQCQTCHTTYRQPFADGSFRIKSSSN